MKTKIFILCTAALVLIFSQIGTGHTDMFGQKKTKKAQFPVSHTSEEWREKLTDEEYRVLREHGTERAFTSELNNEKRDGVFVCAACQHELYPSHTKFDSGTGWPSFYDSVSSDAVGTTTDYKLVYPRTEVHCANCGGHLGHIFKDGPAPTGLRHCINGVALDFVPSSEGE